MDSYFNLQTKRLQCRKLTESDIPKWYEFFKNNDRLHFLGIDMTKNHEIIAEEWVTAQFKRYETHGIGHLAIELKSTGELIGLAGLIPRELHGENEIEVAFSLIPKYWGNGYATEIALALKAYGYEYLNPNRLISIIEITNVHSARVAIKNGMSLLFKTQFLGMDVDVFAVSEVK